MMRQPRSRMKEHASGPNTPRVSTATGTNKWLDSRWTYFDLFFLSASSATALASLAVNRLYEGARVSGQVPHQHLAPPPWDYGSTVWPLTIRSVKASWFQVAGDLRRSERSFDNLIDYRVMWVASLAVATTEAMSSHMADFGSTVLAEMGYTQGHAKTQTHSDPDNLTIHP